MCQHRDSIFFDHQSKLHRCKSTIPFVRFIVLALILAAASASRVAQADGGEGFFQVLMSDATNDLDISVVDPVTLTALPATFTADETGRYELLGLVILNGNVNDPIGEMEITGLGDPELQTKLEWKIDNIGTLYQAPFVLFTTIIAGIQVEEFDPLNDDPLTRRMKSELLSRSFEASMPSPAASQSNATVFLETTDGFSTNALEANVGGSIDIPGINLYQSGIVDPPNLPDGTAENGFTVLVIQNDTALFDVSAGATGTIQTITRVQLGPFGDQTGIPGDYNNDGVVNIADYTVWRDNLGAPAGTLPNDLLGESIGNGQYDVWKANFEATSSAEPLNASTVPEPNAELLLVLGLVAVLWFHRNTAKYIRG